MIISASNIRKFALRLAGSCFVAVALLVPGLAAEELDWDDVVAALLQAGQIAESDVAVEYEADAELSWDDVVAGLLQAGRIADDTDEAGGAVDGLQQAEHTTEVTIIDNETVADSGMDNEVIALQPAEQTAELTATVYETFADSGEDNAADDQYGSDDSDDSFDDDHDLWQLTAIQDSEDNADDGSFKIVLDGQNGGEDSVSSSEDAEISQNSRPQGIYSLDLVIDVPNGGRVEGYFPDSTYPADYRVVLTAVANAGYEFAGWSSDGEIATDANFAAVVMNGNRVVTAKFTQVAVRQAALPAQSKLTVGPNPVPGDNSSVSLYWSGGEIRNAALSVYDAAGVFICKLPIKDPDAGFTRRGYAPMGVRRVGEWALNDRNLRPVPAGTYLVRGTVTMADGSRERVSTPVAVK